MPKFDNPTKVDLNNPYEFDGWNAREIINYIARDPVLIEIARKSIEDQAIEMRDTRAGVLAANGIVVNEKDGTASSIIRVRTPDVVMLALKAISEVSDGQLSSTRERYRQAREAQEQ